MEQRGFSIETRRDLRGYAVEWSDAEGHVFSRHNELFVQLNGQPMQSFGTFPTTCLERGLAFNRVAQRALRFLYYNVIKLHAERVFVTFQKSVGLFERGEFVPVKGLERPARFLRGGCAVDAEGGVYLGEYLRNPDRGEVIVYYLPPGQRTLEIVHRFDGGAIRHVHGVYFDPFERDVWLLTGDAANESGVLRTRDRFRTLETIGAGDESWRAVSIAFRDNAIYYGTDANYSSNHVFKLRRGSLQRTLICDLPGPIYYTRAMEDRLLLGGAAESPMRVGRSSACLWTLNSEDELALVARYRKDRYPLWLMPGTFHFPLGDGAQRHLLNCIALGGVDNTIMELKQSGPCD